MPRTFAQSAFPAPLSRPLIPRLSSLVHCFFIRLLPCSLPLFTVHAFQITLDPQFPPFRGAIE
jgi:hypothetical protein